MTAIRKMELGRELGKTVAQINSQLQTVEHDAKRRGISPHDLQDSSGNWVMVPLLAAKAQALHALVLINQKG